MDAAYRCGAGAAMSDDHKEIWLECACGERHGEERQWCQDNYWKDSECDHEDCAGPVRYVRADIAEANKALIAELVEALKERIADEANGTSGSYRYAVELIAKAKAVQP